LIVDDHPLFTEALAVRLRVEPDIEVLGVAHNPEQALDAVAAQRPAVVILDVLLGGSNGIDALQPMLAIHPELCVVMLTSCAAVDHVVAAVRRGATAWLRKSASSDELVRVIRGVVRGERWIPPDLLGGVLVQLAAGAGDHGHPPEPLAGLTGREREVLQCMVDGLGKSEIAGRLHLSPNTVRTHTQNVLAKTKVHSGLEAVAFALRAGMRPTDSAAPWPAGAG
jgi:DNA-binding NarL/FixJ family response regulator